MFTFGADNLVVSANQSQSYPTMEWDAFLQRTTISKEDDGYIVIDKIKVPKASIPEAELSSYYALASKVFKSQRFELGSIDERSKIVCTFIDPEVWASVPNGSTKTIKELMFELLRHLKSNNIPTTVSLNIKGGVFDNQTKTFIWRSLRIDGMVTLSSVTLAGTNEISFGTAPRAMVTTPTNNIIPTGF